MSQIIQRSNFVGIMFPTGTCVLFFYLFIYFFFFCFGGDPVSIGISMTVSWMHHISNPLVDL